MTTSFTWDVSVDPNGRIKRRPGGSDEWAITGIHRGLELPVLGEGYDLDQFIRAITTESYEEKRDAFPLHLLGHIGSVLKREFLLDVDLPPGGGWIRLRPPPGQIGYADTAWNDGFVRQVPWLLLANDLGGDHFEFLARAEANRRWIVTLSAPGAVPGEVRFPWAPRMLLIMPDAISAVGPGGNPDDPDTFDPSGADDHLKNLVANVLDPLYGENPKHNENVTLASTWREFRIAMNHPLPPEVIYFFGHGKVVGNDTLLVYDRDGNARAQGAGEYIRLSVISDQFRRIAAAGHRPLLLYMNCCSGDTDGQSGIGSSLAGSTFATIANRSEITPDEASVLGTGLLERILLGGLPPHLALLDYYDGQLSDFGAPDAGGRWAIPVSYSNYTSWVPQALARRASEYLTGLRAAYYSLIIPEHVGRETALRQALSFAAANLATDGPTLSVLIWYATPWQGPMHFSSRLYDALRETNPGCDFSRAQVAFECDLKPSSNNKPPVLKRFFASAVAAALSRDWRAIKDADFGPTAGLLQDRLPRRSIPRGLLVVNHQPITRPAFDVLFDYLGFWRTLFDTASPGRKGRVLLAIPVEGTPDGAYPPMFEDFEPNDSSSVNVKDLVPEFGSLQRTEIKDHLWRFRAPYNVEFRGNRGSVRWRGIPSVERSRLR